MMPRDNIDTFIRFVIVPPRTDASVWQIQMQRRAEFLPLSVREWLNNHLPHGFMVSPTRKAEHGPIDNYCLIPPTGLPFMLDLDREVTLTITVTSRIAEHLTEAPK